MSRLWKAIVMLWVWRRGALHARQQQPDVAPSERYTGAPVWAERLVVLLLLLVPVAALAFVALFTLHPNTQLLGLALGAALALLAGALVLAGGWLVPQETKVEQRPGLTEPEAARQVREQAAAGVEGITRRRLLAGAAGVAGAGLTAAIVIPVTALGPGLEGQLRRTPWYAGRALVDEQGNPILAADVIERSFLTAFPQHADKEDLGSPVVVVRVDPTTLKLPAARTGWAPKGILAYSKICTHAACAISLFRDPLSPSTESKGPALVCPCHYSTFDVLDGGSVEFGPAGRPLPQLPLQIDTTGALRAAGPMSGPVGPAWWGDPS
ncbi:MAG TPA: Rieske 2Fe-2S domain-containing protein [Solirubrobacteraceae bacterium]|nr:Rieske 2Fe-2S domain-containing protein [Solirubrobacteraceae bacterium]